MKKEIKGKKNIKPEQGFYFSFEKNLVAFSQFLFFLLFLFTKKKVEKLSKDKFFEILKKNTETKKEKESVKLAQPPPQAKWSVLDQNYLLRNQKLKDWDTQLEEDQQMEQEMEGELETGDFDDPYEEW